MLGGAWCHTLHHVENSDKFLFTCLWNASRRKLQVAKVHCRTLMVAERRQQRQGSRQAQGMEAMWAARTTQGQKEHETKPNQIIFGVP